MGRQIIRLTESDLHKIIKESVIRALNEAESVKDKFSTYRKEPWGDWRDDYDAYMDDIRVGDKPAGEEARLKYIASANRDFGGDPSKKEFNGDQAFFKALKRHQQYRDIHDKHLSPAQREARHQMDMDYDEKYGFNPDDEAAGGIAAGEAEPMKKRARRGSLMTKIKPDETFRKAEEPKSKFSGMSPEELEAKMREMGFAK